MGNVKETPGQMSTLLQWRQEENGARSHEEKRHWQTRPECQELKETLARLNQGLSNHRTICPIIMDPGIKKQILGAPGRVCNGWSLGICLLESLALPHPHFPWLGEGPRGLLGEQSRGQRAQALYSPCTLGPSPARPDSLCNAGLNCIVHLGSPA